MALRTSLQEQEISQKRLDQVAAQSSQAATEGKIAGTSNDEIQVYVATEKQTIESNKKELQQTIASLDDYTRGKTKVDERDILFKANGTVVKTRESVRIIEKKTEVIIDFLGNETFSRSEIGAIFQPGVFRLTPASMKEAQRLFSPVVEKLFTFADKYREGFKKLKGEIIVTGYSDATPVEPGSKLYDDLLLRVQKDDNIAQPTSSDLNRKLSELRAIAIKELLENVIRSKKQSQSNLLNITINTLGRGEEIPLDQRTSMAKNDRRRRIVTFYWVVLPSS
ncbi:hypothetical protein [Spirosoma telluris]|uniref:hypothetical protein n=1 Tax=Spirosoma telluris TaxID=2183553 RepID=UPI001313F474